MAKVQYGVIVTDMKGKIAGQVFQGGNIGNVLRNKGYVPGIKSGARSIATSNMMRNTTAWKSLTDAQRETWNEAALEWPFVDKFGRTYTGSGYQMFVAYNTILIGQGNDPVLVPTAQETPTDAGLITLNSSGVGVLTLDYAIADLTGSTLGVFASRPVSPGKNGNHIAMRLLGYYDYSAGTPLNLAAQYVAKVGPIPSGYKIFVRTTCNSQNWPYPYFPKTSNKIIP